MILLPRGWEAAWDFDGPAKDGRPSRSPAGPRARFRPPRRAGALVAALLALFYFQREPAGDARACYTRNIGFGDVVELEREARVGNMLELDFGWWRGLPALTRYAPARGSPRSSARTAW